MMINSVLNLKTRYNDKVVKFQSVFLIIQKFFIKSFILASLLFIYEAVSVTRYYLGELDLLTK